jgi:hypothetical protein
VNIHRGTSPQKGRILMRIRTITKASAIAAAAVLATAGTAHAALLAEETFDAGTGDWTEYGAAIAHDSAKGTLLVTGSDVNYGAHSYYGGVASSTGTERTTALGDGYVSEIDVYLDPAVTTVGAGFDLSVAASRTDGKHLRDFIFHVGQTDQGLLVNGSNNTDFVVNENKLLNNNGGAFYEVTDAGWYTLQHSFYDDEGVLAVDLNLLDAEGELLWTATRSNAGDAATEVGGARYQWITAVNGSFNFDNQSLERVEVKPVDQCGDNAWEAQDFKNQGQCIASLVANEKAGK